MNRWCQDRTPQVWGRGIRAGMCVLLAALVVGVPQGRAQEGEWDAGLQPVSIVTNGFVGVRDIMPSVAAKLGLGLQMAPDVQGEVNVHLVDVSPRRALDSLMDQASLGYEVADGVLVIHRQGMVTRWFDFDYPVTQREGRGELEISAGNSGGESSSGGGEGTNQNKSHVTSTAKMSIWPEVMESLKTLVFAGEEIQAAAGGGGDGLSLNLADAGGRSLVANPMAGVIQVTAEFDRVQRVGQLLEKLGASLQRQVAIEVRIMEVTLDEDTRTGINWSTFTGTEADADLQTFSRNQGENFFQFIVDSKHLTGTMQALAGYGNVKTLSTPRITTLNNQKAVVRVVKEDVYYEATVSPSIISSTGVATEPIISYTPRTVSIGVVLDVTPQVGEGGLITMNVHPTISDVVGVAISPNADQAPILSIRELDTVGKVRNGQTLVIAGLLSQRSERSRSGIPVLKDIPLLGMLFGSTEMKDSNVELVMLLTPILMEGDDADAVAAAEKAKFEKRMQGS